MRKYKYGLGKRMPVVVMVVIIMTDKKAGEWDGPFMRFNNLNLKLNCVRCCIVTHTEEKVQICTQTEDKNRGYKEDSRIASRSQFASEIS